MSFLAASFRRSADDAAGMEQGIANRLGKEMLPRMAGWRPWL
jgi:hypothetical protein